jgi:hypothetical protein
MLLPTTSYASDQTGNKPIFEFSMGVAIASSPIIDTSGYDRSGGGFGFGLHGGLELNKQNQIYADFSFAASEGVDHTSSTAYLSANWRYLFGNEDLRFYSLVSIGLLTLGDAGHELNGPAGGLGLGIMLSDNVRFQMCSAWGRTRFEGDSYNLKSVSGSLLFQLI